MKPPTRLLLSSHLPLSSFFPLASCSPGLTSISRTTFIILLWLLTSLLRLTVLSRTTFGLLLWTCAHLHSIPCTAPQAHLVLQAHLLLQAHLVL